MIEDHILKGRCLCGAVTVTVPAPDRKLRACHCDMCQQHTSGIYFSILTDQEGMEVTGPATTFRSSHWAERAFCSTCGSTLWYGTVDDGARHLSAGLFPNAGNGKLVIEFYSDERPDGYKLGGDQRRLNREETIALFTGEET
ncbi:MAG: GFA family protein [Pseudomonadota bacterium]